MMTITRASSTAARTTPIIIPVGSDGCGVETTRDKGSIYEVQPSDIQTLRLKGVG